MRLIPVARWLSDEARNDVPNCVDPGWASLFGRCVACSERDFAALRHDDLRTYPASMCRLCLCGR